MKDTGKLSDEVTLNISITDRVGRTHSYMYRHVMRYQIDDRPDGSTFIAFWADARDRLHEAVAINEMEGLGARLMRETLRDPKMLTHDDAAVAQTVGTLVEMTAMFTAGTMFRAETEEGEQAIFDAVIAKLRGSIASQRQAIEQKVREKLEEAIEQAQRAGPDTAS